MCIMHLQPTMKTSMILIWDIPEVESTDKCYRC